MRIFKFLCRPECPQYSPNGIRAALRLLLLLVFWPFISKNFDSLASLKSLGYFWNHYFSFQNIIADYLHQNIFLSVYAINLAQLVALLLGFLAIIKPTRLRIIFSLLPVLIIEQVAYRYRGQFYDIDLPMACLLVSVVLPIDWKNGVFKKSAHYNCNSTSVGLVILTYVVFTYFLAGISKLHLDLHWWQHVDLAALNGVMDIWHGAEFHGLHGDFVKGFAEFFYIHPWLDQVSSLIVLITEMSYPLVLLYSQARSLIPINMTIVHILILITSGISFHAMGLTALAIVIPSLAPNFIKRNNTEVFKKKMILVPIFLGLFFSIMPTILGDNIHPFTNHMQFGWKYDSARHMKTVYAAGVFADSYVRPLPLHYGGFFGFRQYSGFADALGSLFSVDSKTLSEHEIDLYLKRIKILCATLSEHNSNRRLGWLSYPNHIIDDSKNLGKIFETDLFVIRREITWKDNQHYIQNHLLVMNDKPLRVCELTSADIKNKK